MRRQALTRWEPYLAFSSAVLAYLDMSGILPSRLWIPSRIRRAILITWVLLALPAGLVAALLAATQLRLAVLPAEEYERRYKEAEERRRQRQDQQHGTEQPDKQKRRRKRRQPRKSKRG